MWTEIPFYLAYNRQLALQGIETMRAGKDVFLHNVAGGPPIKVVAIKHPLTGENVAPNKNNFDDVFRSAGSSDWRNHWSK